MRIRGDRNNGVYAGLEVPSDWHVTAGLDLDDDVRACETLPRATVAAQPCAELIATIAADTVISAKTPQRKPSAPPDG